MTSPSRKQMPGPGIVAMQGLVVERLLKMSCGAGTRFGCGKVKIPTSLKRSRALRIGPLGAMIDSNKQQQPSHPSPLPTMIPVSPCPHLSHACLPACHETHKFRRWVVPWGCSGTLRPCCLWRAPTATRRSMPSSPISQWLEPPPFSRRSSW